MKRFLDDIKFIFFGSKQKLYAYFEEINKIDSHLKFTMSHTTPDTEKGNSQSCPGNPMESISYLDTSCSIKEGRIITDLYRKPMDKNNYLLA